MATTKGICVIAILACVLNNGDAKITKWITPNITTATGAGTITLPENTAIGATSIKLKAESDVKNSTITYSISPLSDVFTIANSTGILSLSSKLDYETKTTHTITVKADDKNGTVTATVTISVGDNEPDFSQTSYEACIADGAVANTSVASVKARGETTDVTYKINAGNGNGFFQINAKGEITVANTIKKSNEKSYTLTVECVKSGKAGDTAEVKVALGPCPSAALNTQLNILTILVAVVLTLC